MKIEEGKYYRTRDGRKVGPMRWGDSNHWPWDVNGTSKLWNRHGQCDEGVRHDLISEWSDETGPKLSSASIDRVAVDSIKWHYNEGFDSDLEKEAFRIVLRYYGVSVP